MKKTKKLITLLLTFCLMIGLNTTAFASDTPAITTLKNNKNVIIVQEVTDKNITIATNNKITNLLTVEKYDNTGNTLISSQTINLNNIADKADKMETPEVLQRSYHWGNGDDYQHTFTNREYDVWYGDGSEPNEWKCRDDDITIWVDETSSNSSALETFRSDVEDVNEAEYLIIGAVGGTVATTAISAFLSGGIAAGIAAAGGGSAITAAFVNLNKACNNADYHFKRI